MIEHFSVYVHVFPRTGWGPGNLCKTLFVFSRSSAAALDLLCVVCFLEI